MPDSPPSSRPPRLVLGLLVLVVASPAVFAWLTGNIWEDFFITYRCSLNLAQGHGLVFEEGRRIHAFTSPLGTLLPAGLVHLLGTPDPVAVLNGFRVLACAALGLAWWLARRPGLPAGALLVAGLFWVLDAKLAAFATNGMETALLVLSVILAWSALVERRPVTAGVALAAALWTRPDGFVFVGALAVGALVIGGGARWRARDVLLAAAVAAVLYTPWFAWAWGYYGSPVPNTVVAKGSDLQAAESLRLFATYPLRLLFGHVPAHDAFLPPYFFFGEWPAWLTWFGRAMALAAGAVAFWPRCARPARVAAVAFLLGGLYLSVTTRAPWYFPGWTVLAYLALGGGVAAAWDALAARPLGRPALVAGVAVLLVAQAWLFVAVTVQLRAQQRIIEWGLRAPIGRSLRASAASPRETVFLEPLGYIGFYSNLAMRDTPGLCAPEVIRLRRAGTRSMGALVAALRPDWTVLRATEVVGLAPAERAALERDYQLVGSHDVRAAVDAEPWLPGREFLRHDAYFTVWRRKAPAAAGTP